MTPTRTKRLLSIQPAADGGGSETALIRMLRELTAAGWECHVALPHPPRLAAEYAAAGATVHIVAMERITTQGSTLAWSGRYVSRWPGSVARLTRLARAVDADIVHTNSLHSWYGWAVARLVGRPHVWHARELVVQSGAALRVERALTRRFARPVLAMSGAIAAQLHPGNVEVAIDVPAPGDFSPAHAGRFRRAAGIPDGAPLVGSVARIDTWKGFDVLLDAAPLLRERRPDVTLVIAGAPVGGKEPYADGLRRRAGDLGYVHWLGPRRDVADLMADLDVFVQVSTAPEPFGLVHVEALGSGVPIVAGDEGGPVEILAGLDAGAGRLVPAGDPVALAGAVSALLPAGDSSVDHRLARPSRRPLAAADFPAIFDAVLAGAPLRAQPAARRRYSASRPSPAAAQES